MSPAKRKYGYNPDPRISANQLAEYLNATATQRKKIIEGAKFPKTVAVARYDGSRDAVTGFLCDRARDGRSLAAAIAGLKAKETASASPWVQDDCRASVEAIQLFQKSYNKLGLPRLDCRPIHIRPKILIEGVSVSVALCASVHRKDDTGQDRVGGLVLMFSKSEASPKPRREKCKTAATLAFLFSDKHLKQMGQADKKISLSYDIFGNELHHAPTSSLRRIEQIQVSCEEIAMWWGKIDAPDDYDGPALK